MIGVRSNKVKNNTPFKKWLDKKTMVGKESYFEDNYIPIDISYEFENFKVFLMKEN